MNVSILYHPHPQADRDRVQEIKTWWQDNFGRVQVKLEELNEDFVAKDRLATLHVRVVDHVWPTHSEVGRPWVGPLPRQLGLQVQVQPVLAAGRVPGLLSTRSCQS